MFIVGKFNHKLRHKTLYLKEIPGKIDQLTHFEYQAD